MKDIRYTFLLPAFKAEFFAESLESIVNQSFQDYICFVSDDCSPDNIKEIFDQVVGNDSRFVYRRNDVNIGGKSLVAHWNLLVNLCETDYFIMASDDDVYGPNFLKEIDELIDRYPHVDMFRAKMQSIDESGLVLRQDSTMPEYIDQLSFLDLYYSERILSCEACFCYKTQVVKNLGKYKEFPLAWFADDAQHIQMSKNGCAFTRSIQFSYRFSEYSITSGWDTSDTAKKKLIATFSFHDWFMNYYNTLKDSDNSVLYTRVFGLLKERMIDHINRRSLSCNKIDIFWLIYNLNGRLGLSRYRIFRNWLIPKLDNTKNRLLSCVGLSIHS